MFHLAAYTLTSGAAATLSDMTAATDGMLSTRNGHYILSEDYSLLAAFFMGATVTDLALNVPRINAFGRHRVFPPQASATVPSNPQVDDYRAAPILLPRNEEIALLMSNGAAETDQAFLWFGTNDWNMNIPRGLQRITLRCTAACVRTANQWSALGNLTFETSIKGGVYAVVGAYCFEAATLAFRLQFSRQRMYMGRKLFPGDLGQQVLGNSPNRFGETWLGTWGYFHTFEPPQLQVFSTGAGAGAEVLFLDCVFMGEDASLIPT